MRQNTGCFGRLLNLVTALFLLAAIFIVAFIGVSAFAPELVANSPFNLFEKPTVQSVPTLAAVAVAPTPTITGTPTPRLLPTWTPLVEAATVTSEPTNTRGPTLTPSNTPIFPTRTPTRTPTPTPTNTPTETPIGPTATPSATRAAFPFTKSDTSPFYLQNSANSAGCDWMGIAGEVLDLERNPVSTGSYRVHVWGSGIDERVSVGAAPVYSPSGWEQFLFNAPTVREYNVQLESANGTAVSQVYAVQTRASCSQNLLRFDFVQNH